MKKMIGLIFALFLTGCAAKHEAPTGNTVFSGDKTLSLGGNMELLAGNSEVANRDKEASAKEMAAAARVTNAAIITGQTTAQALATGALNAGNLAFGLANLMTLGQDNYKHLDVEKLVLMKLDAADVPTSQATLEKAFRFATNPNSPYVKNAKFNMEDGELLMVSGGEKMGYLKFTTLVSQELVNRIDPTLPVGKYAAFGLRKPSAFSSSYLTSKELSHSTWYFAGVWSRVLGTDLSTHEEITYKVDHVGEPNAKTLVVNYQKTGEGKYVAPQKVIGVQMR